MRLHYPIGHEDYDNFLFQAYVDIKYNPFLDLDEARMVITKNDERGLAREREEWHSTLAGRVIQTRHPVEEDIRQRAFDKWLKSHQLPLAMTLNAKKPAKLHLLLFSHHNPAPFGNTTKRLKLLQQTALNYSKCP